MTTLATFNANNFFLRYRFVGTYPGDQSKKSAVEAGEVATLGYVPEKKFGKALAKDFIIWDPVRRELAAAALAEPDGKLPDILCLQEVENMDAVRRFNEEYLGNHYPYALLIDGHDPRNIDVAVLSRFPIREVRTHIDDCDAQGTRIFSRDCLEVTVDLPKSEPLTLFVNHLKSKYADTRGKSPEEALAEKCEGHERRRLQAQAVLDLIEERFHDRHDTAFYAVVGDFNDTEQSPWLSPLLSSRLLVDVLARTRPEDDRWTYYWRAKGRVQQIDYLLVSKALAARVTKTHIERAGLGYDKLGATGELLPREVTLTHFEDDGATPVPKKLTPSKKLDFQFARYEAILENWGNCISDHCPVKVWF